MKEHTFYTIYIEIYVSREYSSLVEYELEGNAILFDLWLFKFFFLILWHVCSFCDFNSSGKERVNKLRGYTSSHVKRTLDWCALRLPFHPPSFLQRCSLSSSGETRSHLSRSRVRRRHCVPQCREPLPNSVVSIPALIPYQSYYLVH